jgi:hypothetical protein
MLCQKDMSVICCRQKETSVILCQQKGFVCDLLLPTRDVCNQSMRHGRNVLVVTASLLCESRHLMAFSVLARFLTWRSGTQDVLVNP